jgi:hypothetical protein
MRSRIRALASTVARTVSAAKARALTSKALKIGCSAAASTLIVLALWLVPWRAATPVIMTGLFGLASLVTIAARWVVASQVRADQVLRIIQALRDGADRRRIDHDPGQTLAGVMNSRIRVRTLARILADVDRRDVPTHELGGAHRLALELERDLDRDRSALARIFASPLRSDLARAIDVDRRQIRGRYGIDRAARDRLAAASARVTRFLIDAHHNALALVRALDERQVDVSGADLSRMDINPDLLNGTIWTRETTWPDAVKAEVEANSDPIRDGVYQVRLGDTRDRDPLIRG